MLQKHDKVKAVLDWYSPVHKQRKFLLVLGQTSEKSWKTMRPTIKHMQKRGNISSLYLVGTTFFFIFKDYMRRCQNKCGVTKNKRGKKINRPRTQLRVAQMLRHRTLLITFSPLEQSCGEAQALENFFHS